MLGCRLSRTVGRGGTRVRLAIAVSTAVAAGAIGSLAGAHPAVAAVAAAPGSNGPLVCVTSANLHEAPAGGGRFTWTVRGGGSCVDSGGTYLVTYSGTGSSNGLGLCSGLLVQSLNLPVKATFLKTGNLTASTQTIVFSAPVSLFPVATPVLVSAPGAALGAGVIATHYFGQCPPAGMDDALIDWVEV